MVATALLAAVRQTRRALGTWPDRKSWKAALALAAPATAIIALSGYLGGWLHLATMASLPSALLAAFILFFVPALAEELAFRGVLLSWFASLSQRVGNWLSIALYVLWHPVQALAFGQPWSAIYLQPSFLFATFILGIVLTHVRIRSQSLWPVIAIHWLLVVAWTLVLGGPYYWEG